MHVLDTVLACLPGVFQDLAVMLVGTSFLNKPPLAPAAPAVAKGAVSPFSNAAVAGARPSLSSTGTPPSSECGASLFFQVKVSSQA